MFTGWISLSVKNPKAIGQWYREVTGLEVFGEREGIGAIALGSEERGPAIILLPGDSVGHPEKLQMHFPVADVDAKYEGLRKRGIHFDEPPEDKPWGWRHACTRDSAGHTVELCTPAASAEFTR
jgi:catechol 2,3-dioxygenase-like lactoylglutathione lyase family enzyme